MTCAPATPGICLQTLDQLGADAPAFGGLILRSFERAMIGSGTVTPNRFSFIHRADFAERIGPTPMMTPSLSVMPSAR